MSSEQPSDVFTARVQRNYEINKGLLTACEQALTATNRSLGERDAEIARLREKNERQGFYVYQARQVALDATARAEALLAKVEALCDSHGPNPHRVACHRCADLIRAVLDGVA